MQEADIVTASQAIEEAQIVTESQAMEEAQISTDSQAMPQAPAIAVVQALPASGSQSEILLPVRQQLQDINKTLQKMLVLQKDQCKAKYFMEQRPSY